MLYSLFLLAMLLRKPVDTDRAREASLYSSLLLSRFLSLIWCEHIHIIQLLHDTVVRFLEDFSREGRALGGAKVEHLLSLLIYLFHSASCLSSSSSSTTGSCYKPFLLSFFLSSFFFCSLLLFLFFYGWRCLSRLYVWECRGRYICDQLLIDPADALEHTSTSMHIYTQIDMSMGTQIQI